MRPKVRCSDRVGETSQTSKEGEGVSTARRYPETVMPIAGEHSGRYERFLALREELLIGYGYNTARAYWGDLDDWYRWADERGKDVLALSQRDVKQYVALLRRRKYSESTVRRRLVAYRLLIRVRRELE